MREGERKKEKEEKENKERGRKERWKKGRMVDRESARERKDKEGE